LCLFGFYNFLIASRTVNFSGLESHADTGVYVVLMTHGSVLKRGQEDPAYMKLGDMEVRQKLGQEAWEPWCMQPKGIVK